MKQTMFLLVAILHSDSLGDEVEVIEIAHYDKLAHLGDRWPVFTRIISIELLEQRKLEHSNDPQNFKENHLRNL